MLVVYNPHIDRVLNSKLKFILEKCYLHIAAVIDDNQISAFESWLNTLKTTPIKPMCLRNTASAVS